MRQQVAIWKHVETLKAASCRSARVPISAQAYWLADLIGLRFWSDAARWPLTALVVIERIVSRVVRLIILLSLFCCLFAVWHGTVTGMGVEPGVANGYK